MTNSVRANLNLRGSTLALLIHWQFDILDRAVNTKDLVKVIVIDIFGQFFDNDLQKPIRDL